jgi:hypothetical protein
MEPEGLLPHSPFSILSQLNPGNTPTSYFLNSSSSTCCNDQNSKEADPGNLSKISAFSELERVGLQDPFAYS